MILVDAEGLSASRPDRPLFTALSLTVATGDRLGVVGLNGSGKSTLLRLLAGLDAPEAGSVRQGRSVRVGFLGQTADLPAGTVRAVVGDHGWQGEAALDRLGMSVHLDADVATLSGGQAKRVALAQVLVEETDLLVLDEPTNHLDLDAVAWLEDHLAAYRGGLVMVTHDRHVLDRVTTMVLEIDRGATYLHDGGYGGYLEARAEREDQAASAESTRRVLARKELAWLRRGAPARTRKPKARIASATALVEGRAQAAAREGELDWSLGTQRLGDVVLELRDVAFGWEGEKPLFEGLDLALEPRARLGLVGPNGSGKSTLLDLLAGRIPATEGEVRRGSTVRLGYADQLGARLDPSQRVRDAVADGQPATFEHDRLLERFWFDADARWAPIGTLSGGERRRLQLLLVLARSPNVLLLDEPTNDLDLDTLRSLEDFLDDFPGAVVVVSHDRVLLDRTVEDVVALDGAGGVARVAGGVAGWLAQRAAVAASPAVRSRHGSGRPGDQIRDENGRSTGKGRSSSTVRRLLQGAEREVAALDRRKAALAGEVDAAGSDHVALARIGADLGEVDAALAAAEERWLELATEADDAP